MKILQVGLLTANIAATENFYSNKLRLTPCYKDENTIRYEIGGSQLTFKLTETLQPVYHIAFEIPADKLEDSIKWISGKTNLITFEKEEVIVDFVNWNAKSVYFYDDNSNILEFIARFDAAHKSEEPFSMSSVINISEIGLATEDVAQLSASLIKNYGMGYYEKQPPLSNFCALGDLNGLLILSSNDRNWFPTDTAARKYPVEIKFEVDGKLHELNYQ